MFELDHAGEHSGWLCAVMEYNPIREFGIAGDAWLADDAGRSITGHDRSFEPLSSGLFTEVTLLTRSPHLPLAPADR